MVSILKSIKSFQYAFKGIWFFFKEENNAKIHLLASIVVVALGFFFKISIEEWLWITLAIGIVWMAEAFNTAIEKLVDLVSPGYNKQAGEIKDLAAGAVVFAATVALVIGILIFKNYFIGFWIDHL
jgi:diacylglycerol kinase